MNGIPVKKINLHPQNWISLIKFVENRSKQKVRLPYCNLYAYAANNPLRYIDPTGMWINNEDGTYTAQEGDTLYNLYGDDWQSKSGFTRDPRTLQVGETVGINNISNQNDSTSNLQNKNPLSIILDYYFSKWSYVPIEGIGVNGGSAFTGSVILKDKSLSIFAEGFLVAHNLVDRFVFFGDATLFIDGKKVEQSFFQYPTGYSISKGPPFKIIGKVNFNYDFSNANSVEVDFHFRASIAVDFGINRYFINYSKYRMKIK